MVYKRPRVKQNQYNKIIPLDSSNPDELRHFDELMASHDAYMKECDEIDAYWENHPLSKMGKEVRAVYDNAKKRWNQFEEAHPYAATGVKIGACVAGAALIIGAVKSLADVIDDDDSGSHDSLNVAADSDDMVMRSRAEAGPEYNIEQITNNTVEDSHPMMDSTGVYWLEGNGPSYDLWHKDNAGNEKEIALNVYNDGYYDVDNGNVVTKDNGVIVVFNKDGERTEIVTTETGYGPSNARISGDRIIYSVSNSADDKDILYSNNLYGTDEKIIVEGQITSYDVDSDVILYVKAETNDSSFSGHVYKISNEETVNMNNMEHIDGIRTCDGKAIFLGSDDGEHWAVYFQNDIYNPESLIKIKDISYNSARLSIGSEKAVIGETTGEESIFDLNSRELKDISELNARKIDTYGKEIVFSKADSSREKDDEIYKTDLSIKEPEPTNTAPKILTAGGEINGKGIEILVEDAEGDSVDLSVLTPGYTLKNGKELVYANDYPEENLTELVKVKATDSKGAYTEKSLEVTVVGTGKEPIIDPNPDPNPDPVDPVPNGNSTGSGAGFWSKYMIPIIGGAAVAATSVGAAVTGFLGYKRKKGKEKGKRPVATYPNEISSRRGAPAYTTTQNVQKAAEA